MLKILQARLQQYMNHELPGVQAGFRKGRGTRGQILSPPNVLIVNKTEIDVFLKLSCFFHDSADVGNLISGSSAFSNQLEHLEVHGSHIAEAWLGEF